MLSKNILRPVEKYPLVGRVKIPHRFNDHTIGGSKGGRSFHARFRQKSCEIIGFCQLLRGWRPQSHLGNPGTATAYPSTYRIIYVYYLMVTYHIYQGFPHRRCQPIIWEIFFPKLRENERNWTEGAGMSRHWLIPPPPPNLPLLNAPMTTHTLTCLLFS